MSLVANLPIEADHLLELAVICEEHAARDPQGFEWLHIVADRARITWARAIRDERQRRFDEQQRLEKERAAEARRQARVTELSARYNDALTRNPRVANWKVYSWIGTVNGDGVHGPCKGKFYAAYTRRLDLYALLKPDIPSNLQLAWSPGDELTNAAVTALAHPEAVCFTIPVDSWNAKQAWTGRWFLRVFEERGGIDMASFM